MSRLVFHECLGRGGFGEVYRATWARHLVQNYVAVKVLNQEVGPKSEAAKRLRDEAKLLSAITHPGIVRVYDLIEIEGSMAMITEYVHGEDLDRCILDGLPTPGLLEVVARVASALAAAWGDISPLTGKPLRLVHRDIKPENIRLSPDGNPKLLDFGVARAVELKRHAQTEANTVMGSYRYMSPERFEADCRPHPSIDVFALGCILYEGLAFKRLFGELTMRQMMMLSFPGSTRLEQHVDARLDELPPGTDTEVIELIRRLTHREPDMRPLPGRLAAMCDDLAEQLPGVSLRQWSRARVWSPSHEGDGSWTGKDLQVSLAGADVDEASVYPTDSSEPTELISEFAPSEEEFPTSDSGFRQRSDLSVEPRLAPVGLKFSDDSKVTTTQTTRPRLDEGTEAYSQAVTKGIRLLDQATSTPIGASRRQAAPVGTSPHPPVVEDPAPPEREEPPAGPEAYKQAQEQQLRRSAPTSDTRVLVANLVALGVLLGLGLLGLLLALLIAF